MKLYEKYEKLRQKQFVTDIVVSSVSGSMALENQAVSDALVQAIVIALVRESELKGRKFV